MTIFFLNENYGCYKNQCCFIFTLTRIFVRATRGMGLVCIMGFECFVCLYMA